MTTGTNLFKNKLNINLSATFDPYSINDNGFRINKLNIADGGGLLRMTSANLNMNFSLDSKSFNSNNKSENSENVTGGGRTDDLFGSSQDLSLIHI